MHIISGMYSFFVEHFMVKDVKYIWQTISYQKLKTILKENKHLRSLPLVDDPDNMILLGSVQRFELIKMIDRHIGREKRLEMAAKWQKQAKERAREELEKLQLEQKQVEERNKTRRPSRFEVMPAPDMLELRARANTEIAEPVSQSPKEEQREGVSHPLLGIQPKKSILKKTNSFNMKSSTPGSPSMTPYSTITGAESRIRSAFDVIFRKSATLQDVTPDVEGGTVPGTPLSDTLPSPGISKKVQLVSIKTIYYLSY